MRERVLSKKHVSFRIGEIRFDTLTPQEKKSVNINRI
jgi:hypothetical protein